MRDAAAHGAAIADLVVRDMLDRGLQQRMGGRQARVVLDVAPAHHGAEPHTVGGNPDLLQFGQLAQDRRAAPARRRERPASASGSVRRQSPAPPRHGQRATRRPRRAWRDRRIRAGAASWTGLLLARIALSKRAFVNYIAPPPRSTPRRVVHRARHRRWRGGLCVQRYLNAVLSKVRRFLDNLWETQSASARMPQSMTSIPRT